MFFNFSGFFLYQNKERNWYLWQIPVFVGEIWFCPYLDRFGSKLFGYYFKINVKNFHPESKKSLFFLFLLVDITPAEDSNVCQCLKDTYYKIGSH